jgi:hypothetical protein
VGAATASRPTWSWLQVCGQRLLPFVTCSSGGSGKQAIEKEKATNKGHKSKRGEGGAQRTAHCAQALGGGGAWARARGGGPEPTPVHNVHKP